MKKLLRRLIYGMKANSETYVHYLRKLGVKVGAGTKIYVPHKTSIDITRPYLIDIGENVQITEGVTILTHGYDWSVLKGVYGEILGSAGSVCIGNNVFIGMNSTILKGVRIGNNTIIGANSLVNKDIPDNCVAAGNPCRVIMSIEQYYKKRVSVQEREAKELICRYFERYGKYPEESELNEFFWLFKDNTDPLPEYFQVMMDLVGNKTETYNKFCKNKKKYLIIKIFLHI